MDGFNTENIFRFMHDDTKYEEQFDVNPELKYTQLEEILGKIEDNIDLPVSHALGIFKPLYQERTLCPFYTPRLRNKSLKIDVIII